MDPASILVLLFAYSLFAPSAAPGTYQAVPVTGAILRLDTRTGSFERCSVGDTVTCVPVGAK